MMVNTRYRGSGSIFYVMLTASMDQTRMDLATADHVSCHPELLPHADHQDSWNIEGLCAEGTRKGSLGDVFVWENHWTHVKCEIPSNVHLQEVILSWKLTIDFRSAFLKVDPLLGCLCVSNCVNVPEVDTAHVFYPGFYEWIKGLPSTNLDMDAL